MLALFEREGRKCFTAEFNACSLFKSCLARALFGKLDDELPTVFGAARALDESDSLALGENLGEGAGLEGKVQA